ncbi:MAG: class I SAM-dependent methyltransferase [Xanthomonadaceae bacterium]|nr:class I SAM-dependent methyltransferase [Xanthomonadaceae bacterium]
MADNDALARVPEPELMDSHEQVAAYAAADFSESNQFFADYLIEHFEPRPRSGRLIDLGCGPGDICIRLAGLLPGWSITGLDAGTNMLARARRELAERGPDLPIGKQIDFRLAHLPDPSLKRHDWQCVVSNSLLHHLPDPNVLWQSIAELAEKGAWVQVMDLIRPAGAGRVDELVQRYAGREADVLKADFGNSLRAAWRVDEVRAQLRNAGLALTCRPVSDRHWMVSGFA